MIDTHCHFEIEEEDLFNQELEAIQKKGVQKLIVSCCTKEEQTKNLPYLKKHPFIYLALGFHPEEADTIQEADIQALEATIKTTPRVVAIGEIGLDYHYTKDNQEAQKALFEQQLILAEKLHLPVVIHSRDATEDTIQLLKKHTCRGVIHCFTGSLETAKIYLEMGYDLGIGGVLTFKNTHLREVVQQLPLEKIVLETDSPYLAPVPYRSQKNSPQYLIEIAKVLAQIKGISEKEVETITTENAIEMFDLSSDRVVL